MDGAIAVASVSGWGRGLDPPTGLMRMDGDYPENERPNDDVFFLTAEENALAEFLGELKHGDFARMLNQLSQQAKDELRSAIGFIQGKALFPPEEQP